jgi:hypothetical protein
MAVGAPVAQNKKRRRRTIWKNHTASGSQSSTSFHISLLRLSYPFISETKQLHLPYSMLSFAYQVLLRKVDRAGGGVCHQNSDAVEQYGTIQPMVVNPVPLSSFHISLLRLSYTPSYLKQNNCIFPIPC